MVAVILDYSDVAERVDELRRENEEVRADQWRVRTVMEGGAAALRELTGTDKLGSDLPVAHLMDSGLLRLATKIGKLPTPKVDPRHDRDNESERKRTARTARIVMGYDRHDRAELQAAQLGRWTPGYGFGVWVLRERKDANGYPYPSTQLRNPIDCYPAAWGPDQQPHDMAVARRVPVRQLIRTYPEHRGAFEEMAKEGSRFASILALNPMGRTTWDANRNGVVLVEYYHRSGTYVTVPGLGQLIDFVPNPLRSGPAFVAVKRIAFDRLMSHYQHVFGIMGTMAKYVVLGLIAAEEGTFRETNIVGEVLSNAGQYKRGRQAVNKLAPGSQVEKPTMDASVVAVFQQIDRLERHFRVAAGYSVIDDAQSPNSFVTGQGVDRLQQSGDLMAQEYQMVMRLGFEERDAKLLEWDERLYPTREKPLVVNVKDRTVEETYRPTKDIKGRWRTRRAYGVLSGFDEAQTIVGGLQLLQGRIIDRITFQQRLDGLEDLELVNARITEDEAQQQLLGLLSGRAGAGDPAATQALVELVLRPSKRDDILRKFFTPEEPQLSAAEQQFLNPQPAAMPDDTVTTLLSRLEAGGGVDSGAQTVGRI